MNQTGCTKEGGRTMFQKQSRTVKTLAMILRRVWEHYRNQGQRPYPEQQQLPSPQRPAVGEHLRQRGNSGV